jgi:hypothetical protein
VKTSELPDFLRDTHQRNIVIYAIEQYAGQIEVADGDPAAQFLRHRVEQAAEQLRRFGLAQ